MKQIETDILVIGSGLAGLFFSLKCAGSGAKVLIATKKNMCDTATSLAQGGIAVCMGKPDSLDSHKEDTCRTGKGLSDKKAVDFVIDQSGRAISELEKMGVAFDRNESDAYELGREGGHSFRRIVHVKDWTGKAIEDALVAKVKQSPGIDIIDNAYAFDLDVTGKKEQQKEISGAYFYRQKTGKKKKTFPEIKGGEIFYCKASAVVIATGGLCALYKNTVNPDVSTGDGIALAYRAGCVLQDLEFIQFHPTALKKGKSPFFLISEAVRGEGAFLVTKTGCPIMMGFERKDLEARDVVSRKIFQVMKKEPVFLMFPKVNGSWIKKRFSGISRECRKWGIDMAKERIPIIPAAHYACGGIKTNVYGETNVKGVYAIGEAASTGLHGANRLASNSLLESVVVSMNAARCVGHFLKKKKTGLPQKTVKSISFYKSGLNVSQMTKVSSVLKDILWERAGIIRTKKGLKQGLKEIRDIERKIKKWQKKGFNPFLAQLNNQLLISQIIIRSALNRRESRGCHFMEDHPHTDEKASHHSFSKNI